eukprot:Selendium_serpulae@DN2815_c0_g1_i3.p1
MGVSSESRYREATGRYRVHRRHPYSIKKVQSGNTQFSRPNRASIPSISNSTPLNAVYLTDFQADTAKCDMSDQKQQAASITTSDACSLWASTGAYPLKMFLHSVASDVEAQHDDPELLTHIFSSI